MKELNKELIAELKSMDTPTVCNAMEIVEPSRRGFGYTTRQMFCLRPESEPMVGFARTATISSIHKSDLSPQEIQKVSDSYYAYIDEGSKPSIVVIQDIDTHPGYGCFWGEVNSAIHKGFGCEGLITDGAVRDLPDVADGFQMLADRVVPSHAFVRIVDFKKPVTVAGMHVRHDDIIHADQHGAVVIPFEAAAMLRGAADKIIEREQVIIKAARKSGFNIEKLRAAKGEAEEIH